MKLYVNEKAEAVQKLFRYDGMFAVDVQGRSGGLVLFWQNQDDVSILSYSRNHIDVETTSTGRGT